MQQVRGKCQPDTRPRQALLRWYGILCTIARFVRIVARARKRIATSMFIIMLIKPVSICLSKPLFLYGTISGQTDRRTDRRRILCGYIYAWPELQKCLHKLKLERVGLECHFTECSYARTYIDAANVFQADYKQRFVDRSMNDTYLRVCHTRSNRKIHIDFFKP